MTNDIPANMSRIEALRRHLEVWHSDVVSPSQTERWLENSHAWHHATGEIVSSHDISEILIRPKSAAR